MCHFSFNFYKIDKKSANRGQLRSKQKTERMLGLPLDVYKYMRSFVNPIRYDWRTCKAHEAELVRQELQWYLWAAEEQFDFDQMEEIETWTFYGIKHSFGLYLGGRDPGIPPDPNSHRDNPREWYRLRLQWVTESREWYLQWVSNGGTI